MTKIHSVQLLRAFACLLVLGFHIIVFVPGAPLVSANIGVDLFFVISDYIIANSVNSLQAERKSLTFSINRFSRVAPYYYLVTIIYAIVIYSMGQWLDLDALAASLFFYPAKEPLLPVGWTLNHEMFFYVFIALCLLAGRKVNHWANIGLFVSLVIACSFVGGDSYPMKFLSASVNLTFALGYLIFLLEQKLLPWFQNRMLLVIAILLLVVTMCGSHELLEYGYPRDNVMFFNVVKLPRFVWGILCAFLFVSALAQEKRLRMSRRHLLIRIGDVSYTMYLLQGLLIVVLVQVRPLSYWQTPFIFCAVVVLSFYVFRLEHIVAKTTKKRLQRLLTFKEDTRTASPAFDKPKEAL